MTRLSLLMGLFMSVTVTAIILLLAIMAKVSPTTIIFRGTIVFFIFGMLGAILGSFLEVVIMPTTTEKEAEKLQKELNLEDSQLRVELGDLLDEDTESENQDEFGAPTDELKHNDSVTSENMVSRSDSAHAS